MLGRDHTINYSENALSSTLLKYFTLITIVLKDYDAAFSYTFVDFYLLYDGVFFMQI